MPVIVSDGSMESCNVKLNVDLVQRPAAQLTFSFDFAEDATQSKSGSIDLRFSDILNRRFLLWNAQFVMK